jgi:site-specific DNA-cytosine methylase
MIVMDTLKHFNVPSMTISVVHGDHTYAKVTSTLSPPGYSLLPIRPMDLQHFQTPKRRLRLSTTQVPLLSRSLQQLWPL